MVYFTYHFITVVSCYKPFLSEQVAFLSSLCYWPSLSPRIHFFVTGQPRHPKPDSAAQYLKAGPNPQHDRATATEQQADKGPKKTGAQAAVYRQIHHKKDHDTQHLLWIMKHWYKGWKKNVLFGVMHCINSRQWDRPAAFMGHITEEIRQYCPATKAIKPTDIDDHSYVQTMKPNTRQHISVYTYNPCFSSSVLRRLVVYVWDLFM